MSYVFAVEGQTGLLADSENTLRVAMRQSSLSFDTFPASETSEEVYIIPIRVGYFVFAAVAGVFDTLVPPVH